MEMLYCWEELIPGRDSFQKTNKICDIHFEEGALIKVFITKMPYGTEIRIKEDRALLRDDAIPPIFPKPNPPIKEQILEDSRK